MSSCNAGKITVQVTPNTSFSSAGLLCMQFSLITNIRGVLSGYDKNLADEMCTARLGPGKAPNTKTKEVACSLENPFKCFGCQPENHTCKRKKSALTNKYFLLFIIAQQQTERGAFQCFSPQLSSLVGVTLMKLVVIDHQLIQINMIISTTNTISFVSKFLL